MASLLRSPGELKYRDVSVRGIGDLNSNPRGNATNFPNAVYRLEADGLRFPHIGDNRADWPDDVSESVGETVGKPLDRFLRSGTAGCHVDLGFRSVTGIFGRPHCNALIWRRDRPPQDTH